MVRPWNAPRAQIMVDAPLRCSFPHLRAILMAVSIASAPLLQK